MKKILATVFSIIVCACTSTTHYSYSGTKPGAGQAEFSNDYLACQAISKRLTGSSWDHATLMNCMTGKGWKMQSEFNYFSSQG